MEKVTFDREEFSVIVGALRVTYKALQEEGRANSVLLMDLEELVEQRLWLPAARQGGKRI